MADLSSVRAGVARARAFLDELGNDGAPLGVDWLVNNAGIAESAPLLSRSGPGANDELFDRLLEVNFHGARRLVEELAPGMKERGYGRVVNVASMAGLRGYAYVAAYCASKFALVGYTLAASDELAKNGVTVNAVCPHYVDTSMLDRSVSNVMEKTGMDQDAARDFFRNENPGGRLVTVEEVAEAVPRADPRRGDGARSSSWTDPTRRGCGTRTRPRRWPDEDRGGATGGLAPAEGLRERRLGRGRAARLLFVAGQVAWDEEERIVGEGDFVAQFRRALENVVAVVRAAGGGPEHVVEMTVYVTDTGPYEEKLSEIGAEYRAVMGRHFPAMALVQVAALLESGALVEIQARAALPA